MLFQRRALPFLFLPAKGVLGLKARRRQRHGLDPGARVGQDVRAWEAARDVVRMRMRGGRVPWDGPHCAQVRFCTD